MICEALFVTGALGLPVALYTAGLPTLGGAFLLSSVLIFAIRVSRSRVLAASWLAEVNPRVISDATRLELAKALTCAALAVDALASGFRVIDRFFAGPRALSVSLVLTTAGLFAIGACLFLTRWFAGYLLSRR
jgi:hypothetical protein